MARFLEEGTDGTQSHLQHPLQEYHAAIVQVMYSIRAHGTNGLAIVLVHPSLDVSTDGGIDIAANYEDCILGFDSLNVRLQLVECIPVVLNGKSTLWEIQ